MSSSRSCVRSALVGCPEMGSNTSSHASNSDWNYSRLMAGREVVASATKQRRSRKDGVYHNTMRCNRYGEEQYILVSNSC